MKRFYKSVGVVEDAQGYSIQLDNRPVKTPAKNLLILPRQNLAAAVANEWEIQGDNIDAPSMRLTRLSNSAIDRITAHRRSVVNEISGFATTDLVCYRAAEPEILARRQQERWDPLVSWIGARHDVALKVTTGLLPIKQSKRSIQAVHSIVTSMDDFALSGLHMVTAATGSVVVGLAVADGEIEGTDAWEVSLIDETFQIEEWGEDSDATERRANLLADIVAAAEFLYLCKAAE